MHTPEKIQQEESFPQKVHLCVDLASLLKAEAPSGGGGAGTDGSWVDSAGFFSQSPGLSIRGCPVAAGVCQLWDGWQNWYVPQWARRAHAKNVWEGGLAEVAAASRRFSTSEHMLLPLLLLCACLCVFVHDFNVWIMGIVHLSGRQWPSGRGAWRLLSAENHNPCLGATSRMPLPLSRAPRRTPRLMRDDRQDVWRGWEQKINK